MFPRRSRRSRRLGSSFGGPIPIQRAGFTHREARHPSCPDALLVHYHRCSHTLTFPAFSLIDGKVTVAHVRRAAAQTLYIDLKRLELMYKGQVLGEEEGEKAVKELGMKMNSVILCKSVWKEGEMGEGGGSWTREREAGRGGRRPGYGAGAGPEDGLLEEVEVVEQMEGTRLSGLQE